MSAVPVPPVFSAPWEAQVFALVVSLQEAGMFTWGEWTATLAAEIRPQDAPEAPADYARWLAALETLLAANGIAAPGLVDARQGAFLRAAHATPHGQPVLLANDPHGAE